MATDYKALGKRISNARKQAGITQEALGEQLNMTRKHISVIESAIKRPSRQSMKRLRTIMTECTLAMMQSIRWCDSTVWSALAVQDVELAYELPDAYFHIQTCDDGFDYTLYNKDFTERDGGILETDGDKSVQEAMTELLAEFGCDAAEGKVMDAAELREQVDTAAEQQAEVLKAKLAAERPAPEERLSFYVAECLEFAARAQDFIDYFGIKCNLVRIPRPDRCFNGADLLFHGRQIRKRKSRGNFFLCFAQILFRCRFS